MSRSYRKSPIKKDGSKHGNKFAKRLANKQIRRTKRNLIGKSKIYRKHYDSWNINDYICYYSKADAIEAWYREESDKNLSKRNYSKWDWHSKYKSLEDFLNRYWKKDWMGK